MESIKRRYPIIAAILSLITLGLGQVYNGQLKKGFIIWLMGLFWIGLIFLGVMNSFIGTITYFTLGIALTIWVFIDSVVSSSRLKEYHPKSYNKWYVYLIVIILMIVLGNLLSEMIPLKSYTITGISMEPGILMGDRFVVNKYHYQYAQPKRGELVMCNPPDYPSRIMVKRIIALPGEEIEIKNGQLVINGAPKAWVALKEAPMQDFEKFIVPVDAVFVMGDNANNSYDSRSFGAVKVSSLKGKALYIYWPKDWQRIGKTL